MNVNSKKMLLHIWDSLHSTIYIRLQKLFQLFIWLINSYLHKLDGYTLGHHWFQNETPKT